MTAIYMHFIPATVQLVFSARGTSVCVGFMKTMGLAEVEILEAEEEICAVVETKWM